MITRVLGISGFYHDSAAALVVDGEIVAAAQEERFTRKKHDPRFPRNAINYCLQEAFIEPSDLTAVVFYDNPVLSADRIIQSLLAAAPQSEAQWLKAAPSFLGVKPFVSRYVRDMLQVDVPLLFARHHMSHAASTFYPSPFEEAAILTLDGVGEWATTSLATGRGNDIRVLAEINYPHSLGLLYSAFTYFCGFKVNSGEYKLMGLAPYGVPRYADVIRQKLVSTRPDGSFRLDMSYFGYLDDDRMINKKFEDLLGGPAREPEARITRREMDLAASIQQVTEEMVLRIARHLRSTTGQSNLCLAGGVALNCVANGQLQREKVFDRIWIQPAAGDAGGALGAALLASHRKFGVPRTVAKQGRDKQRGSYLGPAYSPAEVRAFLDRHGHPYVVVDDVAERGRLIAKQLAEGKVVGHLSGRMEFGPRALGARSILGDPRSDRTQSLMNLKIKYRESFRPFAPSVLRERASDYFEIDCESPYMLLVAPVVASRRKAQPERDPANDDMLALVNQSRSEVPAITHVDYSARLQTVEEQDHAPYYALIKAFGELTGCPVVVNTSFNVRGEPIVCSPKDAYTCFMRTEIDVLVLENCVLYKEQQRALPNDDSWRTEYELD
jgi:carbamoyltransferase